MKEEEVVQYLLNTPDFFVRHLDALEKLTLPHPISGKAISLLEYQVNALKKSTASYRGQFERLVGVARENESTMQKSRRLVLASLSCNSLEDFAVVVSDMVRDDFNVPYHSLILYGKDIESSVRSHQIIPNDPILSYTSSFTECFCGMLPKSEMEYLFSGDVSYVRSVAVLPLLSRSNDQLRKCGVLVLGAKEKSAFDKDKGALFLQYIADLLSAVLLRLLP